MERIRKSGEITRRRLGAAALGGKGGGGRPDMAQAGGPNGSATRTALNAVEKALATVINNQAD